MTLQPVVGGVLDNILIIFIAAHAHLLLLFRYVVYIPIKLYYIITLRP